VKGILRRIRGIIGTGLTWAVGLAVSSAGLLALSGRWELIPAVALANLFSGFFMGSAFAVILTLTERNRRLEDLSLWRVALWGAIGGGLVGGFYELLATPGYWEVPIITALLSAGYASGSVAIAKRGDTPLIEGADQVPLLQGD
jgi:hypothetical protein